MADSTLLAIQRKVRRLTRRPSEILLPTAILNEYINTFILYDFPYHARTFNLLVEFNTEVLPNREIITIQPTDIITIQPPVYIAGRQVWFTQDPELFYSRWPRTRLIEKTGQVGDNIQTMFTGTTTNIPILARNVLITSINQNNIGLRLVDDTGDGNLTGTGTGFINYLTGQWTVNFSSAPDTGQDIVLQIVPYKPAMPNSVLFYNKDLHIRPVPDQVYNISFQAQVRPTELLSTNQSPDLEQWWQYIAYGAAKKVFEDAMDTEGIQAILPEFQTQEELVMRTTVKQISNSRTATIYTDMVDGNRGRGPFNNC